MTVKTLAAASALLGAILIAAPASASVFTGETVEVDYDYPAISDVYQANSIVAPASVDEFGELTAIIGANSIELTSQVGDTSFASASFNGLHISDPANDLPAFTSVTIDPATNLVGFNASDITFDASDIYLNFEGLPVNTDSIVLVDVNSTGAVPEPATWAMMLAGFAAIGVAMRRRASVSFA